MVYIRNLGRFSSIFRFFAPSDFLDFFKYCTIITKTIHSMENIIYSDFRCDASVLIYKNCNLELVCSRVTNGLK